jgi:Spy/CpxP family protein refolding chaperone
MRLARALAGCALLAILVLLSSDGVLSQEKKEKDGKVKGQLPQGWSKLDLTAVQKDEIYKINREHKEKVDKLREEIRKLDDEYSKKRVAVLTDEQRKKLIDIVAGDPKDKPKDKDGGKEKAKGKEPDK